MTDPILAGVALREDDAAPVALGRELARFMGAPLALVHVYPDEPSSPQPAPMYAAARHERAMVALAQLAEPLVEEVDVILHGEANSSPVRGLHDAAETLAAALVVVGSSHRGRVGRVMPGGVGERLLHGALCAVAVAPRGYRRGAGDPRRIGVAFVDTPEGRDALEAAAAMAVLGGAALSIYTVLEPASAGFATATPGWAPPADYEAGRRKRARTAVERAGASVPADVLEVAEVLEGDPADALSELSKRLDLLVCGSRGYGPLRAVLLGGVSARLAHTCKCPLIVLPRQHPTVRAEIRTSREEGALSERPYNRGEAEAGLLPDPDGHRVARS
jgi:nucleotide-binding universal stress UspA family protein